MGFRRLVSSVISRVSDRHETEKAPRRAGFKLAGRNTKKDPQERVLRAASAKGDHLSRSCGPDVWNTNRLFGGNGFWRAVPEVPVRCQPVARASRDGLTTAYDVSAAYAAANCFGARYRTSGPLLPTLSVKRCGYTPFSSQPPVRRQTRKDSCIISRSDAPERVSRPGPRFAAADTQDKGSAAPFRN